MHFRFHLQTTYFPNKRYTFSHKASDLSSNFESKTLPMRAITRGAVSRYTGVSKKALNTLCKHSLRYCRSKYLLTMSTPRYIKQYTITIFHSLLGKRASSFHQAQIVSEEMSPYSQLSPTFIPLALSEKIPSA